MIQLSDELLATALVDEIGIEKAIRVLEKAELLYEAKNNRRLSVKYVRMVGAAKNYAKEKKAS